MRQLLKNIAEIGAGQGAPQGDSSYCSHGTPFVKAGNLQELTSGSGLDRIQKVSRDVADAYRLKLYRKGTVLFAKSGMSCLKGYVYILPDDAYVVNHLACITPKDDISDYLGYYFKYHKPNRLVKDPAYPSISLADIGEMEIDIKDDDTRNKRISTLQRIESIIRARKREVAELDNLIKARFVEMSSSWNCVEKPLFEYLESITYGFTNPMPDAEDGPWKITAKDVVNGHVNFDTARKTTKEAFDELTDKSKPNIGDVLLTKDGTLGRTAIVENGSICVNQSVAVLRCNDKVVPRFLSLLLQLPEYQREMTKNSGGGTIKHIYITKVDKMLVVIPSINQQREFIEFVEQVDKSKLM